MSKNGTVRAATGTIVNNASRLAAKRGEIAKPMANKLGAALGITEEKRFWKKPSTYVFGGLIAFALGIIAEAFGFFTKLNKRS